MKKAKRTVSPLCKAGLSGVESVRKMRGLLQDHSEIRRSDICPSPIPGTVFMTKTAQCGNHVLYMEGKWNNLSSCVDPLGHGNDREGPTFDDCLKGLRDYVRHFTMSNSTLLRVSTPNFLCQHGVIPPFAGLKHA